VSTVTFAWNRRERPGSISGGADNEAASSVGKSQVTRRWEVIADQLRFTFSCSHTLMSD
jgi:hypothetical protein